MSTVAMCYEIKHLPQAAHHFEILFNTEEFSDVVLYHQYGTYLSNRKDNRALIVFQKGIEEFPEYECLHYHFARFLESIDRFHAAQNHFAIAYDLNPHHCVISSGFAEFLIDTKRSDLASRYMVAADFAAPEDPDTQIFLASIWMKKKDKENGFQPSLDKVERLLSKTTLKGAHKGNACVAIACWKRKNKNFQLASLYFKQALQHYPRSHYMTIVVHEALGNLFLMNMGKENEGIYHLRKSLELMKTEEGFEIERIILSGRLGIVLAFRDGYQDEAEDLLEYALQNEVKDGFKEVPLAYAEILISKGESEKAKHILDSYSHYLAELESKEDLKQFLRTYSCCLHKTAPERRHFKTFKATSIQEQTIADLYELYVSLGPFLGAYALVGKENLRKDFKDFCECQRSCIKQHCSLPNSMSRMISEYAYLI